MKILIATDGSKYSSAAVEACCNMFEGTKDKIIRIVSVYENVFPVAGEPFAISADYYQQLEDEAKSNAEKFAASAADVVREKFVGVNPEIEVRSGSPERELVECAQEWGADLVVVGSHGRGFWGRMMIGSVSDAIMHHAPCSVMIVRERGES